MRKLTADSVFRVGEIIRQFQKSDMSPDDVLNALIIDGLVAIEQMIDCPENIEFVLSTFNSNDLEKISSNIIALNAMIQDTMKKRKR